MSLQEAFAPAEAEYRSRVRSSTWGHLAPIPRKRYRISVLFCESGYSGVSIINTRLLDGLSDSPWLYTDLLEFAERNAQGGRVSLFDGIYYRCKTGRARFIGKTRVVAEAPKRPEHHDNNT